MTIGWRHRAEVSERDGSDTVLFRWHWPRGTFDPRMSALELAAFVLPHMPHILPLLGQWPQIQREFAALLVRAASAPDEVVPWIKSVVRTGPDDILLLNLGAKTTQPGLSYFVGVTA